MGTDNQTKISSDAARKKINQTKGYAGNKQGFVGCAAPTMKLQLYGSFGSLLLVLWGLRW